MSAGEATTDGLVATGVAIIVDDPAQILDRGLRVEDVFERARVSRATFYRRFATKERYLSDVIDALIAARRRQSGAPPRTARELVDQHLAGGPAAVTRGLLALLFGRSAAAHMRALREVYHHRDAAARAVLESIMSSSGATLRKPFSTNNFPLVLSAILDGLLLRRHIDPKAVSAQLITDVLLTLTDAALSSAHDHGHIYDTLEKVAPATPAPLPGNPRSALIAAARAEFARRGYFAARYESIVETARVPVDGARKLFPTKTHFIVGGLHDHYVALSNAIADDVVLELDDVTVLENHFRRCAQLIVDEPAFMDALIAVVSNETYGEPEGLLAIKKELNLPGLILPVIESGQRAGRFVDSYPAFELAAMMTNTLLLRSFTRRKVPPDETARFVRAMVLDGLLTRAG